MGAAEAIIEIYFFAEKHFVHADLLGIQGGSIAGKVNDSLDKAKPHVEGLHPKATSKTFRIGVTTYCLAHPLCGETPTTFLGGWVEEKKRDPSKGSMYNYAREHMGFIRVAARTVAGADDPRRMQYPARAVFIDVSNRSKMENMIHLCFDHHFPLSTFENKRLRKLAECLLAYLFIMLETWVVEYTREHIVVKTIVDNALQAGIVHRAVNGTVDLKPIYDMGEAARNDMKQRNSLTRILTDEEPVRQLLNLALSCQGELLATKEALATQKNTISQLQKTVVDLSRTVESLTASLSTMTNTPSKKVSSKIKVSDTSLSSSSSSTSTNTSDHIPKLSEAPPNAPFVASAKSSQMTVLEGLKTWRLRELSVEANIYKPSSEVEKNERKATNREMLRFKTVVEETVKCFTQDQKAAWKQPQPSKLTDKSNAWSKWFTEMNELCMKGEKALLTSLRKRAESIAERKVFVYKATDSEGEASKTGNGTACDRAVADSTKNTISAVSTRIEKLKRSELSLVDMSNQRLIAPMSAAAGSSSSSS